MTAFAPSLIIEKKKYIWLISSNAFCGTKPLISFTITILNKYPYFLVLGVDNEIDGNPIRGDDMEMSSEEDGEIFDDVAQNPWASLQE